MMKCNHQNFHLELMHSSTVLSVAVVDGGPKQLDHWLRSVMSTEGTAGRLPQDITLLLEN